MSWSMQREQEHDELVALARKVVNERQQFVDALIGFAQGMRTPPGCGFVKYLEANAPHIRDLLEPFDNRVQQVKCEATFARDENFAEAPPAANHDGAVIRRKNRVDADAGYVTALEEKVEHLAKQLADIATAVKPLRDWWFSETPSPLNGNLAAMTNSYGHDVTYSQLAQIIKAVPTVGSIVDTHA